MKGSDLALVVVIIAAATVVQGISGFVFSLVGMPLLSALLGVERALAIQTTLGIVSNGLTAARAHRDVLVGVVRRIMIATVAGMPFGWFLLDHASGRTLKLLVGIVVGVLAFLLARNVRISKTGSWIDFVSGFCSGVLSTSVGTNGPPLVIGLSGRSLIATEQRATLSTCFAIGNMIVFGALLWSGRIDHGIVIAVAVCLPIVLVSSAVGSRIFARLRQQHYDRVVLALLFGSSAVAIASALS